MQAEEKVVLRGEQGSIGVCEFLCGWVFLLLHWVRVNTGDLPFLFLQLIYKDRTQTHSPDTPYYWDLLHEHELCHQPPLWLSKSDLGFIFVLSIAVQFCFSLGLYPRQYFIIANPESQFHTPHSSYSILNLLAYTFQGDIKHSTACAETVSLL